MSLFRTWSGRGRPQMRLKELTPGPASLCSCRSEAVDLLGRTTLSPLRTVDLSTHLACCKTNQPKDSRGAACKRFAGEHRMTPRMTCRMSAYEAFDAFFARACTPARHLFRMRFRLQACVTSSYWVIIFRTSIIAPRTT